VAAERPAKHHDIHNPEHSEHLDSGVRKAGPRIAAGRVWCVAGLTMPRQIESNQTMVFREGSFHLIAKDAAAGRVSVDQKCREAAMAGFLDRDRAVRRRECVLT
jgi:hypothetical protein